MYIKIVNDLHVDRKCGITASSFFVKLALILTSHSFCIESLKSEAED